MNEKIKQLARQAQVGSAEFGNGISYFVSTEETFNKFAELIIRECARDFDNTYMSGGKTMGDYIRQKFGVEE
jgi:hypothetical protein